MQEAFAAAAAANVGMGGDEKATPQVTDPEIIEYVKSKITTEMGILEKVYLPDEELCAESVECMKCTAWKTPCFWPCAILCGPIFCCVANSSEKKWKVYKYFLTDLGLGRIGYEDQEIVFYKYSVITSAVWTSLFSTSSPCYTRNIYGIRFLIRSGVSKKASHGKGTTWMVRRNVLSVILGKLGQHGVGGMISNMLAGMGATQAAAAAEAMNRAGAYDFQKAPVAVPEAEAVQAEAVQVTKRVFIYLDTDPGNKKIVTLEQSMSWDDCLERFKDELVIKDNDVTASVFLVKNDIKVCVSENADIAQDDVLMIVANRPVAVSIVKLEEAGALSIT
eukprot:CAMPEP_0203772860 /NCGR_PEP_ID=MMETSP0099_2-20121227/4302_1 /ASSEMBLY_ACC=CAM_ASM_000209 /TAXON_ID=96639 /ORGANISM=" , Strain NY0313808BC1" /LENGTH=333 /DNA_ID=CAMNT_0050670557 /DNA_START=134 /DNA_END=1135 /DNA_ORIENTATION=+